MCRTFPIRTAVFTLGPLAVAVAQLLNAFVHGHGSALPLVAVIAVLTCVFSVLITRYHLSAFRRRTLTADFD
jgi:ribosomal protein L10